MALLSEIDKHGREQTGLKATKRVVEKAALRPGEARGRTERVCDVVRAMLVAKDIRTVGAIAVRCARSKPRGWSRCGGSRTASRSHRAAGGAT